MTQDRNVFLNVRPLTEEAFRNTWLQTLGRLCRQHGDAQVAQWLGVGMDHLRKNVKSGTSLPTADKIWNLLAHDSSAHDELDGEYGLRNVGKDAYCTADPLTIDLIELAAETAKDEADDSPGGPDHTDCELRRKNETRLRKVHQRLGTWLHRIDEMRKPRAVRA